MDSNPRAQSWGSEPDSGSIPFITAVFDGWSVAFLTPYDTHSDQTVLTALPDGPNPSLTSTQPGSQLGPGGQPWLWLPNCSAQAFHVTDFPNATAEEARTICQRPMSNSELFLLTFQATGVRGQGGIVDSPVPQGRCEHSGSKKSLATEPPSVAPQ